MATNLIFPLIDVQSNPIIGSLATLRLYSTSGSFASNFPVQTISDITGSATFNNILPGIYKFSWTNSGYGTPNYVNQLPDIVYLNIPDLSGSTAPNGFVYITTQVPQSNPTGSSGAGTAAQYGIDIAGMSKYITNILNDWAIQNQGIAVVAEEVNERIMLGFNNAVGPRCLVVFMGEESYGSEVKEFEGWAKRSYMVAVSRGKLLTSPRDSGLVNNYGPSANFYSLVEGARDVLRAMEFPTPMVYTPVLYNGIQPASEDKWMIDCYVISFDVLCMIGRITTSALNNTNDGSPFLGLGVDSGLSNTTPT